MMPRVRRLLDGALVTSFVVALIAPSIDLFVRPAEVRSAVRENRLPYAYPARVTGLFTLSKWPHDFENWFGDRLGLRDRLLRGHQAIRHFVFHTEATPTLIEGKQGWLYFGSEGSVPVMRGLDPFTEQDLEKWKADIESRRDWLRAHGIEYAFAIAPNKQTIYPELLPDELVQLGPTRLDQLTAYMHAHSDVRFVDLRPALVAEKAHDENGDFVYYPLGSHWSWRGGWVGWNEIARSLNALWPALKPIPRADLVRTEVPEAAGDSMLITSYIFDLVHQRTIAYDPPPSDAVLTRGAKGVVTGSHRSDTSLPATMILHDSFGAWMLPFSALGASTMHAFWQHAFPKETVLMDHSELVVQVYTERVLVWGLTKLAPENDPIDAETFARLPKLWGPIDGAVPTLPPVEGDLRIARANGDLEIDQGGVTGVIVLPIADVPPGQQLALHIDIEAPKQTVLTFFYQVRQDPRFARSRMAMTVLEPGRNDVRFQLRMPDVWGPIKLRAGTPGKYVLHAIEARAAQ
jgi:alginate O-acetyltransferase complex protein AlgJ